MDISQIVVWVDYYRTHQVRTAAEYIDPMAGVKILWLSDRRARPGQPWRLAVQTRDKALQSAVHDHYTSIGLACAMERKRLVIYVPAQRLLKFDEPGAWEKVIDSIDYLLANRSDTINTEERPVQNVTIIWHYTGSTFWLKVFGPRPLINRLLEAYSSSVACEIDESAEIRSNIPYPGYHYVYTNENWTKLLIMP